MQDSFLDALPKPESIDQSLVLAQGTRETWSAAWRVVKLVRPTSDSTAFATGIWQQLRSPAGATPVVWARMTLQITTLAGRSTCDTHFYRGRRFRDDLEVAMATTDVDATDAS